MTTRVPLVSIRHMSIKTCIHCGENVTLQFSGMAPIAALATKRPMRIVCRTCARQLYLPQNEDGDRVQYHGEWFVTIAGSAFIHSDHPDAAYIYKRF